MKLRKDLQLRKLGGDFVIIDPGQDMVDMSKVFTLNDTAAFLWKELLNKDVSEELIVKILLENYEVEESTAKVDAKQFIKDFIDGGLISE